MKQAQKAGEKNKIGAYGETIAAKYLKKHDLSILETNYQQKWGEIDIVARETLKNEVKVHFVEVKTVSYETIALLKHAVTHETWRPEDNVHTQKIKRLHRTIETWLAKNKYAGDWQIDVVAVRIVPRERYATVRHIPNVIIG